MTEPLFRDDAYLKSAEARVTETGEGWVSLDRSLFYAAGGGQPGDTGHLELPDGTRLAVTDTRYGEDRSTIRVMVETPPPVGTTVTQHLDWERRHRLMRMHTALHLLSVALPFPVTGGQIGETESRLDFDMPESPDKDTVTAAVMELIGGDHPVTTEWITDAELDANPELVKTMSVKPPRGSGHVRLVRIGAVDLQPCGGTHVAATAEIGAVAVTKIEKKGRQNRRVRLGLIEP